MNKKYWEKWYKKDHDMAPTSFAKFCLKYIPKNSFIIDVGCGNGRDSYYFAEKKFKVFGVDENYKSPVVYKNNTFSLLSIEELENWLKYFGINIVYSRFLLHAIEKKEITKLIKWTKGMFMAECRAKGDEPKLYKNHKRNLVDGNKLVEELIRNNFDILYYEKSKGLAKYRNENPLIVRVIAKKITEKL